MTAAAEFRRRTGRTVVELPATDRVQRVLVAQDRAREALDRARGAEWDAGRAACLESPLADRAAAEVMAAVAELVKFALGVEEVSA